MSTVEDFKNAPGGAIATSPYGGRAMKIYGGAWHWITSRGNRLNDTEMELQGYTLGPAPAPTTAREALDLAWELAHEVEEGQTIPAGTDYLVSRNGERPVIMRTTIDQLTSKAFGTNRRTLDPLPEPEPDWLDAPAVLASDKRDDTGDCHTWINVGGGEWFATRRLTTHWSTLRHVTPLYPKGQDA